MVRGVNQTENAPLVFVPADRIEFGLRYSIPNFLGFKNGYAEANVQLVDTQRNFDPSTDLVDPPPGYALLGAQVGVERRIAKQLLTIGIEGRNLTNAVYREYTSLRRYFADEPGIEVALRIGLRFGTRADSDSSEDEISARE